MLGWWLGVSHRVLSALYYWILSEKGKVILHTTVQHLTDYEPRYPNFQERIRDYHGLLEALLGIEDFGTIFDGYDSFINDDKEGTDKGDPNEEEYQRLQYSPEIDEIVDKNILELRLCYLIGKMTN